MKRLLVTVNYLIIMVFDNNNLVLESPKKYSSAIILLSKVKFYTTKLVTMNNVSNPVIKLFVLNSIQWSREKFSIIAYI